MLFKLRVLLWLSQITSNITLINKSITFRPRWCYIKQKQANWRTSSRRLFAAVGMLTHSHASQLAHQHLPPSGFQPQLAQIDYLVADTHFHYSPLCYTLNYNLFRNDFHFNPFRVCIWLCGWYALVLRS